MGPACWLWDYLRRSGAAGYFLPLSGGADSSSTAAIVGVMCQLVSKAVRAGDSIVTADVKRILDISPSSPSLDIGDPQVLANGILHCAYMGTGHSSEETRGRARGLAGEIGAYFSLLEIDRATDAIVWVFTNFVNQTASGGSGMAPRFLSQGGSHAEDLALQNIQARVRMVLSYVCAQLLPWVRRRKGFLLVLGSANVDEGLRGYYTKYDCSAADVNPIGSISKLDLKRLLKWVAQRYGYGTLAAVECATPTAELRPDADDGTVQTDEEDMGMTYEELGWYGRLRKIERCGPVAMFRKLVHVWPSVPVADVAAKVKFFFRQYSINRHKMTTLTPSYHAESYSPDDNRYDLRQFLYNVRWPRQNRRIDSLVAKIEATRAKEDKVDIAGAGKNSTIKSGLRVRAGGGGVA
jgi:NAD+ synthase (glutamine-hydrolysing)